MTVFSTKVITVSVAVLSLLTASEVSAHSQGSEMGTCAHRVEREAVVLRIAQTQLMVAALSCPQDKRPLLRAAYNRFVSVEADALKRSTPILQAYLKRNRIGSTDRYVTELANDIALDAALNPGFCTLTESAVVQLGGKDGMLAAALPFSEKANDLADCALFAGSEPAAEGTSPVATLSAEDND